MQSQCWLVARLMHVEVDVVVEGVAPVVIVEVVARVIGDLVAVGGAMRVVVIGVEAHHRVIVDDQSTMTAT